MSTVNTLPIAFTSGAVQEIKRLQTLEENQGRTLRIGVKGGGCAGFTYILEFDLAQESDLRFEIDGIEICMDLAHELYLSGTTVDFQTGLNNRGFEFINPNAETTCGCGSSFG